MGKFKQGDLVKLTDNGARTMSAEVGATAVVRQDYDEGDRYFYIDWVPTDCRAKGQNSGGYYADDFELVTPAEAPKPTKRYFVVTFSELDRLMSLEDAKEEAKRVSEQEDELVYVLEGITKFVPRTVAEEAPIA